MATAGFFPVLKAIPVDTVLPLVAKAADLSGDVFNVFYDDGLPPFEETARCRMEHLAPFRLALRTEPLATEGRPEGKLDVYYDLVSDAEDFTHRIHAAPTRIAPALAPVVAAIPRHERVASLVEQAPSLLSPGSGPVEDIRRAALGIVRAAAKKGFVRLSPGGSA
jgi:hypothetical protein